MVLVTLVKMLSRLFAGSAVGYYANVHGTNMEQRINMKFLVKLRKSPVECFKQDVMLRTQVFLWHKRF